MPKYTGKKKNWHIACYNTMTGKNSAPRGKSLWDSTCDYCKRAIFTGDLITWSTSPVTPEDESVYKPEPTPPPVTPPTVPTAPIAKPTPVPPAPYNPNDAMANMANLLRPYLDPLYMNQPVETPALNEEEIERLVRKFATVIHVNTVEIKNAETGEITKCGIQHKQFPVLLRMVATRSNIWLTGPTGSGKTTAAQNIASELGMKFYLVPACDTKYDLTGFINVGGLVRTQFRDAWEYGGVCLFDEIDSWSPQATLAANAVANGKFAFPDGMIDRHPDFVLIAAANTWGHGATDAYVGRNKLDKAFLNRFTYKLDWQYDEDLEMATAPNPAWTKRVQQVRANVARGTGLQIIISPRISYEGAKLLAAGFSQSDVEKYTIMPGLTTAQWESIR